jgi:hypothetical protein
MYQTGRRTVAGEMVTAWIITIPICAALASFFSLPLGLVARQAPPRDRLRLPCGASQG